MPLRHYALREISLSFASIDVTKGAGEDEFLTIEEPEDFFSTTVGADGTVTRNDMPTGILKASVTLMATSPTNDLLSVIHEADRLVPGGSGVGPWYYANRLGTAKIAAVEAFIRKRPNIARAKAVGVQVWDWDVIDPTVFSGT